MKFYIRTLGCKMNQLDSARVAAVLRGAGHLPTTSEEEAECVLINSCTVTAESDRKSRQAANSAKRVGKQVAVMGCGPRVGPGRWRTRLPDTLLFESESKLFSYFGISAKEAPFPETSRSRLPVAIQTGCDDQCTFCITRLARGNHLSQPVEHIVHQIQQAEAQGVREVVLTGINLAAWGCENSRHPEHGRLHKLLAYLLRQTTVPRIRLSSLGPQFLGRNFFEILKEPRICDHLHLSVQSGSLSVLERMGRGHGVDEVYRAAEQARRVRPDVALTADFIVGFPGETEQEFADTLAMVEKVGFAKLHVFRFSAREGTPAAAFSTQLPSGEKKRRAARLREAGKISRAVFLASQWGKKHQVLLEGDETGLSTNYIRLYARGGREGDLWDIEVQPGTIADRW